jgi:hypothetical protein
MNTQFDIESLNYAYTHLQNYKIIDNQTIKYKKNRVIVCFSGNGLYYPNNDDVFKKAILENDYYEWENIMKNNHLQYTKIVFIRDLRKTWYIDGINITFDSIENVLSFLKQTLGKFDELICVGNSAGGYAALVFGILLGAQKIFCISGYAILDKEICYDPLNPSLKLAYNNPEKSKWLDLTQIISNSTSDIFYFYPAYSSEDQKQYNLLKDYSRVYCFAIDSDQHGAGAPGFLYPYLFNMRAKRLRKISRKGNQRVWSRDLLSQKTLGYLNWRINKSGSNIIKYLYHFPRKIYKKLKSLLKI